MASIVFTWDANFNSSPAGSQSIRLGDDRIRDTRSAVEERATREHFWGPDDTNSKHGRHRSGSARAYYQDTAPTTAPDGDTLGSDDAGRLNVKPASKSISVWDGSQWAIAAVTPLTRISVAGTLATGTNLIPAILFTSAFQINKVIAMVGTAPTGASLQIDLNKNGVSTQSIFGATNYISIAATSTTGSQSDFDDTHAVFAAGDYMTMDIDQVGSTEPGKTLSISIEGIPA